MKVYHLVALVFIMGSPLTFASGFTQIELKSKQEIHCVIPDHNGGEWGCRNTVDLNLFHTAEFADQIVITNLSIENHPSVTFEKVDYKEIRILKLKYFGDFSNSGLKVKDGLNKLKVELFEDGHLNGIDFYNAGIDFVSEY